MNAGGQPGSAADTHGYVAAGFERVAEEFERNFTERGEVGGAFAAFVHGELVVDLWGGIADRHRNVPWTDDTLVGVFSGSKGLVATCLLLLIERGKLNLEAPVCHYWPEFATHGKQRITVAQLVSHRAGLPGLATPVSIDEATDSTRMADLLAKQVPLPQPGTWCAYHAMTFGWLAGELVRRVDGRSVGRFFRDDIAQPLGLDCWIGLPDSLEPRVAKLQRGPGFGLQGGEQATDSPTDQTAWSIWANPPRFSGSELAANTRAWHTAEIPATNAIVTARSMARLYGCLARGGELDGITLLSPATVELGRRRLTQGRDPYLQLPMAFGVGFQLQTSAMEFGPGDDAYGHAGAGGSVHGAWPALSAGFSYAPNLLAGFTAADPRATALLNALHAAIDQQHYERQRGTG